MLETYVFQIMFIPLSIKKKLIQLFKEYNKAIEGKHPDKFQEIYEECLTIFIDNPLN